MGLLTQLITLPLAPLRGAAWVIEQVAQAGEGEYYDSGTVNRELRELEQALIDGNISEEQFDQRENDLLDRLQWLKKDSNGVASNPEARQGALNSAADGFSHQKGMTK